MSQLILKELKDLYLGWAVWFVLVAYVVICYSWLWFFPSNSYMSYGYASPAYYFSIASYLLMFIIPAISYGVFSYEFRHGTFEVLRSLPVSNRDIVLSKFLAVLSIVIWVIVVSWPHLYTLQSLSTGHTEIGGEIWTAYVGLILVVSSFVSIGVFSSSLFDNPALSFLVAVVLGFMFYEGWSWIGRLPGFYGSADYIFERLTMSFHVDYLSKGVLTLSSLVYFVTVIALFLISAIWRLERREF